MNIRSVYILFLVYFFFLSYPHTSPCSAVPIPLFNISTPINIFRNVSKRLWNNKNSFKKFQGTTTVSPKTTTKTSWSIVFVPKWTAKTQNSTTNITTSSYNSRRNETVPSYVKADKGFVGRWWEYFFGSSETTTPKPTHYVWLVPVNFDKMTATRPPPLARKDIPCKVHKSSYQEDCKTIVEIPSSSLSWWMILLILSGTTTTLGLVAWALATRGCKENFAFPCNFLPPRSQSVPRLPTRAPAPLPAYVSAQSAPSDPTSPTRATLLINPYYHTTTAAGAAATSGPTPVHVYATPTLRPGQSFAVWTSGVADHVHIYEPPPSYPSIDSGDTEIDTTYVGNNGIAQESKSSQGPAQ